MIKANVQPMGLERGTVVFLSQFKSGTHLFRRMLSDLLGLPWFEPPLVKGRVNYEDPNQLHCPAGHYYTWHLHPVPDVIARIQQAQARPVLLVRNLFDVTVSIYHHFAENIDADIGRGRNVQHHFGELSREEGIMEIIKGMTRPDFRWRGLEPHIRHVERMCQLADVQPCLLTSYSDIEDDKGQVLHRLAEFLQVDPPASLLTQIAQDSSFETMKAKAEARGEGSHYRHGRSGSRHKELNAEHIAAITGIVETSFPTLSQDLARHGLSSLMSLMSY